MIPLAIGITITSIVKLPILWALFDIALGVVQSSHKLLNGLAESSV